MGETKGPGYFGWADWFYNNKRYGSIYAEPDGFRVMSKEKSLNIEAKNNIHLWNNTYYHGTFAAASSKKYKENIKNITEEDAHAVMKLNPVEFDYKNSGYHSCGLIAEYAYRILPQIVELKDSNPDSIDYIKLIPFLLKKIQLMQTEINKLKLG